MMKQTAFLLILALVLVGVTQNSLAAQPSSSPTLTMILTMTPAPKAPHPLAAELEDPAFLELDARLASQAAAAPGAIVPWSKLVFQSFRDSNWEIYLADGDGSNQVRLTENNSADVHPQLNRGCTRIVFASDRSGNYEIYTMNLDGAGLQRLTFDSANQILPAWSPSGDKIVFQDFRHKQAEIYVMDSNGANQTRLTSDSGFDGEPAWSPDGSKIAFVSNRSGGNRVWLMNADGSGQRQLSNQAGSDYPTWSPDGSQIAFDAAGSDDTHHELWLMNADGSNQREVYDANTTDTDVVARSWSPDGRYVAFTRLLWVYYNDKWYWRYGYLYAWDSIDGGVARLGDGNADWRPSWQTTDAQTPISSMDTLPGQSPALFEVSWSGSDGGDSGLSGYDVQVRENQGSWNDWLVGTQLTTASYQGLGGQTYYFRVRARDNSYNVQAWPPGPTTWTTVEDYSPQTSVSALAAYWRSSDTLTVSWGGSDPGGSGIQGYDVQYREAGQESWNDWRMQTTDTAASFDGVAGHTYHFRARATDNAQNVEDWPSGDGDTHTTFYTWSISGTLRDNTGVSLVGATSHITPAPFATSSGEGAFAAFVATSAATCTATWSKDGYGALPLTNFGVDADAQVDVVLPPANNIVRNWGFEELDGSLRLGGWRASGVITPELSAAARHTGDYAALLGQPATTSVPLANRINTLAQQSGASSIAQTIILPITMSNPTLSFLYRLDGSPAASVSWFEVQVNNGTATMPLLVADAISAGWTQRWFDLSPWAGQTIELIFSVQQTASSPHAWVYLDEVSVGSAYPDLWVSTNGPTAALPGEQVIYTITYGNRGGVAASGARISVTFPTDLLFVESAPPPAPGTQTLPLTWQWEAGDLAAGSGPLSIVLTATVAPETAMFSALNSAVGIWGASPEVETANNAAQATVLVAYQTFLPLIAK